MGEAYLTKVLVRDSELIPFFHEIKLFTSVHQKVEKESSSTQYRFLRCCRARDFDVSQISVT